MFGEASDNSASRCNPATNGRQYSPESLDCPHESYRTRRSRCAYAVAIGMVLLGGLASRSSLVEGLPSLIGAYAGDTLWALALFLALGFVFPRARIVTVALLAIVLSFGIELSQLYQAEWINAIRHTRIGALILGFGFKWSDLVCYTVGCLSGAAAEVLMRTIRRNEANEGCLTSSRRDGAEDDATLPPSAA